MVSRTLGNPGWSLARFGDVIRNLLETGGLVDGQKMTNKKEKLRGWLIDRVAIPSIERASQVGLATQETFRKHSLKGEELLVTGISKALLVGAYLTYKVMFDTIHWWPTKRAASTFFEIGQFYRFRPSQIWYTVWENDPSTGNAGRVFFRMKPGSVFMVLDNRPDFPKGTIVHMISSEKVGYICVDGEVQYAPWEAFEKVDYTKEATVPSEERDQEEEDLFL